MEAGSDTTSSYLNTLILGILAFPDAQRKAQEEVDSVVGFDRLPTVDDREHLPYVHAIVKEVTRWYTTVPLGMF